MTEIKFGKRTHWRDDLWLWWHGRKGHQITSGRCLVDEAPYWTCSCKPKKNFYPKRIK